MSNELLEGCDSMPVGDNGAVSTLDVGLELHDSDIGILAPAVVVVEDILLESSPEQSPDDTAVGILDIVVLRIVDERESTDDRALEILGIGDAVSNGGETGGILLDTLVDREPGLLISLDNILLVVTVQAPGSGVGGEGGRIEVIVGLTDLTLSVDDSITLLVNDNLGSGLGTLEEGILDSLIILCLFSLLSKESLVFLKSDDIIVEELGEVIGSGLDTGEIEVRHEDDAAELVGEKLEHLVQLVIEVLEQGVDLLDGVIVGEELVNLSDSIVLGEEFIYLSGSVVLGEDLIDLRGSVVLGKELIDLVLGVNLVGIGLLGEELVNLVSGVIIGEESLDLILGVVVLEHVLDLGDKLENLILGVVVLGEQLVDLSLGVVVLQESVDLILGINVLGVGLQKESFVDSVDLLLECLGSGKDLGLERSKIVIDLLLKSLLDILELLLGGELVEVLDGVLDGSATILENLDVSLDGIISGLVSTVKVVDLARESIVSGLVGGFEGGETRLESRETAFEVRELVSKVGLDGGKLGIKPIDVLAVIFTTACVHQCSTREGEHQSHSKDFFHKRID